MDPGVLPGNGSVQELVIVEVGLYRSYYFRKWRLASKWCIIRRELLDVDVKVSTTVLSSSEYFCSFL